jgi:hypothetical protein
VREGEREKFFFKWFPWWHGTVRWALGKKEKRERERPFAFESVPRRSSLEYVVTTILA